VPRAALEDAAFQAVQHKLGDTPGVREVQAHPLASSLLVLYDPGTLDPAALRERLTQVGVWIAEAPPPPPADRPSGSSELGEAIAGFFGRADWKLLARSGGKLDLRTLVPVTLGVLALREILAGRIVAVPWYALAWYAADSFLKLRVLPQIEEVAERVEQREEE
jgi:hypothetical protein